MKKVVLITGVSSGFGRATATRLAADGFIVYGTTRDGLSSIGGITCLKMDLTRKPSMEMVVAEVIKAEGRIDVLINNAGMHTGGPAETLPEEYARLQMDTNFMGLVSMTRLVLPHMRRSGGGMVINFSSIGGLMGLPFQAYYSASKFAIEGFTEALRMEVKQFNIKVVLINPGDFHTSNTSNRQKYLAQTGEDDPYRKQYASAMQQIESDETKGWDPDILALSIVKIIKSKSPAHRYVIGSFEQKLAVGLKRIIPGKLFAKIISSHYKLS